MLSYLCGSSRKILPIINLPETEFQYENEKVIRLFFLHFTYYMFFLLFFRCHLDEYLSNPLHYSPQGNKGLLRDKLSAVRPPSHRKLRPIESMESGLAMFMDCRCPLAYNFVPTNLLWLLYTWSNLRTYHCLRTVYAATLQRAMFATCIGLWISI